MKQVKLTMMALVCIAVFFAWTSTVSAQVFQDTWFKLNVAIKGAVLDLDSESSSKTTIKTTAYMCVYPGGRLDGYAYQIFCEIEPDDWLITADGELPPAYPAQNHIYIQDATWPLPLMDDTILIVNLSGELKAKLDKEGRLKNATFATLGAYLALGATPESDMIAGGVHIKGKTIDEAKLPFTPPE